MKLFKYFIYLQCFIFSLSLATHGQKKPEVHSWEDVQAIVDKDTSIKHEHRSKIRTYESLVTKETRTQVGLFTVHRKEDSVFFEIPDSILGRDLMVINRLGKGPGGTGMYAGEELDEKTIFFETGPDSTVRIRYDLVISEADSTDAIYKAVVKDNLNPIAISFPILAYGKEHRSYVIDATKFLKEKSMVNSIDPGTALGKSVNAGIMRDVYIEYIHAYPINVEISISKNTDRTGSKDNGPATVETHTSFIELPKVPLQRRFFDPRVGYFADTYYAFGDHQQKSELKKFILRWRLEPKDEDVEKWKKGELVEPKQPIVIYIDPAAPKQWRPYLIQGINDWQKAFEQAGFKNAIMGKEWPENDTTMQLDDARFSMLNYLPSEVANAYGPQIHDPRSGEIIQTHIGWYHNVMTILHDWYFIQAAAVDPRARKAKFDESLMGELIRFVSSHEVGHTLGLRHNFGSSSQTPVDSLRSKHYLDIHGHTASIMDYARFNYVAQPEDNIPEKDLFPRIGEYDRWAIEWGYKSSQAANAEEDKKIVSKWTTERLGANHRLWFGDGETRKTDPRCQTEDLSDDAVKASAYGIKNLQRILPNLPAWTHEEGDLHENLAEMYKSLTDQYFRYMGHVLKNIGGVYYTVRTDDDTAPVYAPDPKGLQERALAFFDKELFTTPTWLMAPAVIDKVAMPVEPNFIQDLQAKVLNSLLDISRIGKLLANQKQFGAKAYDPWEYITNIHHSIWRELNGAGDIVIDTYRRSLQKCYLGALVEAASAKDEDSQESDASSLVKADIYLLKQEITQAIPRAKDPMTMIHLKDLENRLKDLLEHKGPAGI